MLDLTKVNPEQIWEPADVQSKDIIDALTTHQKILIYTGSNKGNHGFIFDYNTVRKIEEEYNRLMEQNEYLLNLLETVEVQKEFGERLVESKKRRESGMGIELPEGMSLFDYYQQRRNQNEE